MHAQNQQEKAKLGVLLALSRVAEEGGMLESDLLSTIRSELHIKTEHIEAALDRLVRRGSVNREAQKGFIASGDVYSINAKGVAEVGAALSAAIMGAR